jgi:hypothetical protein
VGWYALAFATVVAASTRGRADPSEQKFSTVEPKELLRSGLFTPTSKVQGRVVRSLDKLFDGGGFPPLDGGDGDGGDGDGEKFVFLDASKYCDMLDTFANGAAVRRSERLARHSADEYIECVEEEHERTMKMQEDRQRLRLEKRVGMWEGGTVPDVSFIAMREEEDRRKVSALFSVEQSESSDWRNWIIRYVTGDPRTIAPRLAESDPWRERYKLYSWLANHQMRLFVERRYFQRDFWYGMKSEGFDL